MVALGVSIGGDEPTRQFGTGFFVRADGHLITRHHVKLDLDKQARRGGVHYCVGVGSPIEWTYEAEFVHNNSPLDLAILRVTRRRDDVAPVVRAADTRRLGRRCPG